MGEFAELNYVDIPSGAYELGWRFEDMLSTEAKEAMGAFLPWDELLKRFSPERKVELPVFSIATTTIPAEELLSHLDEDDDGHLESLGCLCRALDLALAPHNLRLPSEDELEAACGGGMFSWGHQVPDGVPWQSETTFKAHLAPNQLGLELNSNPYQVEIVNAAFKLGDGGEALCGGYPWPIAWLSLSPSYRLAGEETEELLGEFLEDAQVRPVHI